MMLSDEERCNLWKEACETNNRIIIDYAEKVERAVLAKASQQGQGDARAACDAYIESLGGAESNAWHDAPVDGVFIDGFEAGRKAMPAPKQEPATKQELADAIMGFAGDFIGAYLNGFIDTPLTNIAQIYQVARNHVKDSYGIDTKTLTDEIGKEDFDRCYAPVPSQAAAIPEGWQLVPIEPTPEMMLHNSGCKYHASDDLSCKARQVRVNVWRYMLSAAPKPEGE